MAIADSPPALGARVRALREAMDLSLRDLAERCGVSAPMLSQVERGETSPTLQVATRIAHGLELRLSQLLSQRLHVRQHAVSQLLMRRRDSVAEAAASLRPLLLLLLLLCRTRGRCRDRTGFWMQRIIECMLVWVGPVVAAVRNKAATRLTSRVCWCCCC